MASAASFVREVCCLDLRTGRSSSFPRAHAVIEGAQHSHRYIYVQHLFPQRMGQRPIATFKTEERNADRLTTCTLVSLFVVLLTMAPTPDRSI